VAALIQIAALLVCFCGWFYLRTVAYLKGPPDGDAYAQTWSFQLIVGAIYLVAALLLGGVLILLEAAVVRFVAQIVQSRGQP
jgi:hypothetical protein